MVADLIRVWSAEIRVRILFFISFSEALDTPGCIHKPFVSGKKRMTFRANFDADIFLSRAGVDHFSAGAGDGCFFVLWMKIDFHDVSPLYMNFSVYCLFKFSKNSLLVLYFPIRSIKSSIASAEFKSLMTLRKSHVFCRSLSGTSSSSWRVFDRLISMAG